MNRDFPSLGRNNLARLAFLALVAVCSSWVAVCGEPLEEPAAQPDAKAVDQDANQAEAPGGTSNDAAQETPAGGQTEAPAAEQTPSELGDGRLIRIRLPLSGNADAHIKRQVMGREVVVAVTEGKLDFGPWEQIFYGEFDGGRKKRVLVKIIGE